MLWTKMAVKKKPLPAYGGGVLKDLIIKQMPRPLLTVDLFPFQQISKKDLQKPEHIAALPDYDYNQPDGELAFDWSREIGSGEMLTRFRRQHHLADGTIEITFCFKKQTNTKPAEDMSMTIHMQNYSVDNFKSICAEANLTIKHIYGDYSKKSYEPLDPRMIFILGAS